MRCPRDESELLVLNKGRLHIEQCAECNGFFVNLTQQPAAQLSSLLKRDISTGERHVGNDLKSPLSGDAMQGFMYRGVQLDYCEKSHSVWFDHGEYTKIFAPPLAAHKTATGTDSQNSNCTDTVLDVAGAAESSLDVFGFVGDLVGDLVSGIDIF